MKNLAAVMAAGVVVASAYAAAENTVTLKRDILGRVIGVNEKQPVLLKKPVVKKTAEPMAATSMPTWSSYDQSWLANKTDKYQEKVSAVFKSKGLNDALYYEWNGSAVSENTFKTRAEQYESRDQARNDYKSPIVSTNKRTYPLDKSRYDYQASFQNTMYQAGFYDDYRVFFTDIGSILSVTGAYIAGNDGGKGVSVYLSAGGLPMLHYSNHVISSPYPGNSQYREIESRMDVNRYGEVLNKVAPKACYKGYDVLKAYEAGKLPQYPIPVNTTSTDVDGGACGPFYIGALVYTNTDHPEYNIYSHEAGMLDDYVYYNRIIQFASAGEVVNGVNYPNPAAAGLNVITVGGVDRYTDKALGYVTQNPRINRGSGAEIFKPEILAYNRFFMYGNNKYKVVDKSGVKSPYMSYAISGRKSSAAATVYSAGLAADLLSARPFYRWHPEVVKALMLTASVISYSNMDFDRDNTDRFGAAVGKYIAQYRNMLENNVSRYWLGNNGDHFVNGKISFNERIEKGRKYRIAISWLTRGDYTKYHSMIQQDMTLKVTAVDQNGNRSTVYTSDYSDNGFQLVEFTAPVTGNYQVEIIRKRNGEGNGRVILGYNCHEVQW